MTFNCQLCESSDEWLFAQRYCEKCRRIKKLLNLYGQDVYDCLEQVFVRDKQQQQYKKNDEIKKTYSDVLKNIKKDKQIPKDK
tara:strand:- start:210 stop:458 length:249 start_codon:yes stop_codon:yes gene_type:complete